MDALKVFHALILLVAFSWFTIGIILGDLVLLVCKLLLPRPYFLQVATQIQGKFLSIFVHMYERNHNMTITISGDPIPPEESALVLPNHLNQDWAPLYCLAVRKNMLGNVRGVLKDVVKWLPGYGWAMWLMSWPYLKRSWEKDQKSLSKLMTQYRSDGQPLHVWCFPEGTRWTPAKFAEAQAFAQERGLKVLPHTLQPRTKGFIALAQGLQGTITHVYDVALAYEGWDLQNMQGPGVLETFFPTPRNRTHTMHMHVKRIPVSELPLDDPKGLSTWLFNMFAEKNERLAYFHEHKRFPGQEKRHTASPLQLSDWLPGVVMYSCFNLVFFCVWNIVW